MDCRPGCGACCIAPSISSPIPGMAAGKPAGIACPQLDEQRLCRLFATPQRPEVCRRFGANSEHCGDSSEEAMLHLEELERLTR